MKILIPNSLHSALRLLASLTQETFDSFIAIVNDVPATMSQERFIAALKSSVIGQNDQEPFIDAAFGLQAGYRAASVTTHEFAADVAESFSQISSNKLADRDEFEARIRALLGVKSLTLASRARGLLYETERHASEFRIVSDIRPVFDKPGTTVLGAIIMHNLRISYHEQKDSEALFLSLDADDLRELLSATRRALEKEEMLTAVVASSGLKLIRDTIEDKQKAITS